MMTFFAKEKLNFLTFTTFIDKRNTIKDFRIEKKNDYFRQAIGSRKGNSNQTVNVQI